MRTNPAYVLHQCEVCKAWAISARSSGAQNEIAHREGCKGPRSNGTLVPNNSWLPASGGHEDPFTLNGKRLLYCFNLAESRHAYVDLDSDMVLTDEEALRLFVRL